MNRFNLVPPVGLNTNELILWNEKMLCPVQLHVCQVLILWVESYWIDDFDDVCLDNLHDLASNQIPEIYPHQASKILELVSKRVLYH
jgi:hypothetical protein